MRRSLQPAPIFSPLRYEAPTRPFRAKLWALIGGLLGLSVPLGWLVAHYVTGHDPVHLFRNLGVEAPTYSYLLIASTFVLALVGHYTGRLADRLSDANARLASLAVTDALTGLRNTRYFHERLLQECARAHRDQRPLGLVMLDVDHFKEVNDRRGHAFGDLALAHLAKVIFGCARQTDVVCRVGGEEFAVLCPGAALEETRAIAERIRAEVEGSAVEEGGRPERLTVSAGVCSRLLGQSHGDLYRAADAALYEAKRLGRNRVEVTPQVALRAGPRPGVGATVLAEPATPRPAWNR